MAYIPQLTPTNPTNTYTDNIYHSWNPFEQMYNPDRPWRPNFGMPNCTAYAFGRFWSLAHPASPTDNKPTLSLGNGREWWGYTQDGYQRGQTPKLGAIICYDDAAGSPFYGGHVAIVEEIFSDGSIRTSNSGYTANQAEEAQWFFWTELLPSNYARQNFTFQGFIFNPFADSESEDLLLWSIKHRRKRNDIGKSRHFYSLRNGESI